MPLPSVFEEAGAKVVVDEGSLALLKGAVVDFEDDMLRSAPPRLSQHPAPAPTRHSRALGFAFAPPPPASAGLPRAPCRPRPAARALPQRPAPPPSPSIVTHEK